MSLFLSFHSLVTNFSWLGGWAPFLLENTVPVKSLGGARSFSKISSESMQIRKSVSLVPSYLRRVLELFICWLKRVDSVRFSDFFNCVCGVQFSWDLLEKFWPGLLS